MKTAEELYNGADLKHRSKLIKLLLLLFMITANNALMCNKTVFKFLITQNSEEKGKLIPKGLRTMGNSELKFGI
jgi:hypothetical protein